MHVAMKNRSFLTTTISGCAVFSVVCFSYGCLYTLLLRPVSSWQISCLSHIIIKPDYVGTRPSQFVGTTIRSFFEPAYRIDRQIRPKFWRRPIDWPLVNEGRGLFSPRSMKVLESYIARQNSRPVETTNNDL